MGDREAQIPMRAGRGPGGAVRGLRCVALAFFLVYVIWNGWWLAQRQFAPSLLVALTGLPAPSTGMTRSVRALLAGEWGQGLLWNPFTLPLLGLFVLSLAWLALQACRRQRLALPRGLAWGWWATLLAAWATKLLLGPQYW